MTRNFVQKSAAFSRKKVLKKRAKNEHEKAPENIALNC